MTYYETSGVPSVYQNYVTIIHPREEEKTLLEVVPVCGYTVYSTKYVPEIKLHYAMLPCSQKLNGFSSLLSYFIFVLN